MSEATLPKPGRYKGKVVDFGAKATQAGQPAIAIRLAFKDDEGKDHSVTWQGSLGVGNDPSKKRPLDITLETLEVCGFDFHKHKDLTSIADGPTGGALDTTRELMITVEHESFNGTTYAKARYLNPIGGFKGGIDRKEFVVKCNGLNLEAEVAQFRQKVPKPVAAATKPATATVSPEDIPF